MPLFMAPLSMLVIMDWCCHWFSRDCKYTGLVIFLRAFFYVFEKHVIYCNHVVKLVLMVLSHLYDGNCLNKKITVLISQVNGSQGPQ